jgi:uncharacterized damage-inducible protein DinB
MTPQVFQTFARYNAWMNENIYRACETIPDSRRKQDMGAFFKSIHGTLNHLLIGDRFWMARFEGKPLPAVGLDAILHEDFNDLRAARHDMDTAISGFAANLTDDWLAKPFTFTSRIYDRTFTQPTWRLVMQLFNHQTHHRGQVTTLMMQCGVDPGPTDLPAMPDVLN